MDSRNWYDFPQKTPADLRKVIRVILTFKQNNDVDPEKEDEYFFFEEDSEGYFL